MSFGKYSDIALIIKYLKISRLFFFHKKEPKNKSQPLKNLLLENLKNEIFDGSENH